MRVIALVGNKGGAGKTSLAVNIAVALEGCLLVDADPQGSALQWRELALDGQRLAVVDGASDPAAAVAALDGVYAFCVIDCPPSVQATQTRSALELADLALIPVQPSPLDLWATVHIEGAVAQARLVNPKLAALLVINQLEPRTRLSQMVREGLDEIGLPVAQTAIRRRIAYRTSILEGRSVHDMGQRGREASEEIHQLISEVIG